jgi:cell division protein FtsB
MSKLTDFYKKYIVGFYKYWLVAIVFLVFAFLIGDSNKYNEKIRSLENEIEKYRKEIEQNRKKIEKLQTDKMDLEQFAREEYLMKKPDEDIFIVDEGL